nr:MAG TPA: hypothetical protein [Caudoviricetes sp.]
MMTDYERLLVSIDSANLTANLENVAINEEILKRNNRHEKDNDIIISLLTEILGVLKNDSSRNFHKD